MRRRVIRRLRTILSGALVASLLLIAVPGPASAATIWVAFMTGDQEVPGPGDPSAVGAARLTIDPAAGEVCVEWDVLVEDPATAAHIHTGAEGVSGGVVVTLPTPDGEGLGGDCVTGLDEPTLQGIVDDPAAFYVNVHNATYQAGALRGQLETFEVIPNGVNLGKAVCPAEIQTPAQLLAAAPGTCTIAALTGTIGDPPAGSIWDPEPLEFDMQVELEDLGGVLTMDDAELEGGSVCYPDLHCSPGRSYMWRDLFVGPATVTELTFPDGYRFGWATVYSVIEGADPPPSIVDVASASVSFDTTGFEDSDGIGVALFDFLNLPSTATPPPAPTTPPTATAPVGTQADASGLAMLVAYAASLLAVVLISRRIRLPR